MKSSIFLTLYFIVMFATNAAPCQEESYRQFDFWLGEWTVSNPKNSQLSASKITSINSGCTLLEEYSTPTGYVGKSLNIYDATSNQWHQTWTDNSGLLLQLVGAFDGTSMVLQGEKSDAQGKVTLNRITWTPNKDGTVRQLWEASKNNGEDWQILFDGLYRKV